MTRFVIDFIVATLISMATSFLMKLFWNMDLDMPTNTNYLMVLMLYLRLDKNEKS